jgi:hypothetical protein
LRKYDNAVGDLRPCCECAKAAHCGVLHVCHARPHPMHWLRRCATMQQADFLLQLSCSYNCRTGKAQWIEAFSRYIHCRFAFISGLYLNVLQILIYRRTAKRTKHALHRVVLPKLFSTATQFLERQFIATHIALLDKRKF